MSERGHAKFIQQLLDGNISKRAMKAGWDAMGSNIHYTELMPLIFKAMLREILKDELYEEKATKRPTSDDPCKIDSAYTTDVGVPSIR